MRTFVATGAGGATRTIDAASFFTGLFETALAPNEVLTEIRVPKATDGWSFLKFNRRAQDWALGRGLRGARQRRCARRARRTWVSPRCEPTAVEEELAGGADAATAAARADEGTAPPDDAFASSDYRRALVKVLTQRALQEAMA